MDLQLLFDLVGSATLAMILVTGVLATGGACHLAFQVREQKLLQAFTPICLLPSFVALLATLNSVITGISIQLQSPQSDLQISTTTRLLMHATPLLVGLAASVPALFLTHFIPNRHLEKPLVHLNHIAMIKSIGSMWLD